MRWARSLSTRSRGKARHKLITLAALAIVIALATVGGQVPLVGPHRTEAGFVTMIAAMLALPMDALSRFLLYWTLSALFAYTAAGEKMPWLNVHIALPLSILAGRSIGGLVSGLELRVDLPPVQRWAPVAGACLAAATAVAIFIFAGLESSAAVAGWLLVAAVLLTVVWSGRAFNVRTAARVAATALGAMLLVFTVRASVLSSWGHPDLLKDANTLASRDRGDTPVETAGLRAVVARRADHTRRHRQGGGGIRRGRASADNRRLDRTTSPGRGRGTCASTRT